MKHLNEDPVPPSERVGAAIPAKLERIVLDCLAKDPAMRPQSASELARRLRETGASWDETSAREWWSRHGPLLKARRAAAEPVTGSARTLAVDYESRA